MIFKIRHVGLKVKDLDKSIKFYRNLGFSVISRGIEHWDSGPPIGVCKLKTMGGEILELIEAVIWPENHFALTVNDLWSVDHLKILKEKKSIKYHVIYVKDLDGHWIELVQKN
ncbi:MAG: VOC family protein [Desulfobacteraceae bacterium]|nr:MAG: VOC family protein [Desulfobacteraceae bacterium]